MTNQEIIDNFVENNNASYRSTINNTLGDRKPEYLIDNFKDVEERYLSELSTRGKNKGLPIMVNTKASRYSALSSLLKIMAPDSEARVFYKERLEHYRNTSNFRQEKGHKKINISWNKVANVYKSLSGRDQVIAGLYSLIPPLRTDFINISIYQRVPKDNKVGNFMVMTKSNITLYLNEYKTSAIYGQFKKKLPFALDTIVRDWINEKDRKILFDGYLNHQSHLSAEVSKIFTKTLDNKIGIDEIRSIWTTTLINSKEYKLLEGKEDVKGMEKLHNQILHSRATALKYYNQQ